jgi:hypothetical protein
MVLTLNRSANGYEIGVMAQTPNPGEAVPTLVIGAGQTEEDAIAQAREALAQAAGQLRDLAAKVDGGGDVADPSTPEA